jgi:hypothetical protein
MRLEEQKLVNDELECDIPSFLSFHQEEIGKEHPVRNELEPCKSKSCRREKQTRVSNCEFD